MFRVTLTVMKNISQGDAAQIIEQLTDSLTVQPETGGGPVASFQKVGQRQVQGWLRSADEVVGFILSAARSGSWGVNLTALLDKDQVHEFDWSHGESGDLMGKQVQELESLDATRAPGGVQVMMAQGNSLVGAGSAPALGLIEAGMQLLCSIERRRSVEGQEAGLMINAGSSQRAAAEHLSVSQQAVSSRLQAGYWYESRRVAYWLAQQLSELMQS